MMFRATSIVTTIALLTLFLLPKSYSSEITKSNSSLPEVDIDLLEFPLNLEYLEAEFFLYGALGYGLDKFAPNLTLGGPTPFGGKRANLGPFTRDFALQEVGHLRAIQSTVKGFPRPLLNLSAESFAKVVDSAFETQLVPCFDPYRNGLNFLLASYLIPYVGLTGYLVAGLLGVESGQDAVIRALLYKLKNIEVKPYGKTVAEFTSRFSQLRDKLGNAGVKDEGLVVPKDEGAEGLITGNVLAGDKYSVAYDRTPEEILRIVYGSGDERKPGGFYPKGADGRIAKSHLSKA
ncbi:desiccation-related protein pcc13-62 [Quercus suber]|uniref:Desiccation-related protein pcc13-62 n=1 Tax=Quercus suber TaxID=58331 RepID=A0AAW0LYP0_QUESU